MRALALLLLVPAAAWAQDGMDVSEPSVAPEFMPSIAVLGVVPAESDPVLTSRAGQLQPELLKAAQTAEAFSKVVDPAAAATVLGEGTAAAKACTDYACFQGVAKKLGVNRLIVGVLAKSGPASMLTLHGFDGALPELVKAEVESNERQEKQQLGGFAGLQGKSQATKDKEFLKKAQPIFFETLKLLQTPNGKLQIDSAESTSIATLNNEEGGVGSFEKVLPRGSYEVKVTAAGYLPFETRITVEEQKTASVHVVLVAKPIERAPVAVVEADDGVRPIYARPSVYVIGAGVVACAVGVGLGLSARGVEGRAVDKNGDGIVEVTRAEAQSAKSKALMANVLVGAGAAAVAGGTVWFFLTPSKAPAPKKKEDGAPANATGTTEGSGGGWMVGVGGTF